MRKWIYILLIFMALAVIAIAILPMQVAERNEKLAGLFLREWTYHSLADQITEKAGDQNEAVQLAAAYTYLKLHQNNAYYAICDVHPHFDLVREIAWCDQKANVFMQLLYRKGIQAANLTFSRHTVGLARTADATWVCDLTYGENFRLPDPGLYTDLSALSVAMRSAVSENGVAFNDYAGAQYYQWDVARTWQAAPVSAGFSRKFLSSYIGWYRSFSDESLGEELLERYLDAYDNAGFSKAMRQSLPLEIQEYPELFDDNFLEFYRCRSLQLLKGPAFELGPCLPETAFSLYKDEVDYFKLRTHLYQGQIQEFLKEYRMIHARWSESLDQWESELRCFVELQEKAELDDLAREDLVFLAENARAHIYHYALEDLVGKLMQLNPEWVVKLTRANEEQIRALQHDLRSIRSR